MKESKKKILIAIQARSTSKRLPGKVHATIDGQSMVSHVIEAANNSARYLNKTFGDRVDVCVRLLIPTGDELKDTPHIDIIEGDENDVLSRYSTAMFDTQADYICRITGDCPFVPPFLVSKMIKIALMNKYDYVSNVDEETRTYADGQDVEVISGRLLEHIRISARDKRDREHVTVLAREEPPGWAKLGTVVGYMDLSKAKISVDTEKDLARVRKMFDVLRKKLKRARVKFGPRSVHRV